MSLQLPIEIYGLLTYHLHEPTLFDLRSCNRDLWRNLPYYGRITALTESQDTFQKNILLEVSSHGSCYIRYIPHTKTSFPLIYVINTLLKEGKVISLYYPRCNEEKWNHLIDGIIEKKEQEILRRIPCEKPHFSTQNYYDYYISLFDDVFEICDAYDTEPRLTIQKSIIVPLLQCPQHFITINTLVQAICVALNYNNVVTVITHKEFYGEIKRNSFKGEITFPVLHPHQRDSCDGKRVILYNYDKIESYKDDLSGIIFIASGCFGLKEKRMQAWQERLLLSRKIERIFWYYPRKRLNKTEAMRLCYETMKNEMESVASLRNKPNSKDTLKKKLSYATFCKVFPMEKNIIEWKSTNVLSSSFLERTHFIDSLLKEERITY